MTHRLVRRGVYIRRVTGHVERQLSLSAGANAHRLPRPAEPPRLLGQEEQINSRRASPCQAQTRVLTTRCHVVQQSIHSIMRRVMTPDPASLVPHRGPSRTLHTPRDQSAEPAIVGGRVRGGRSTDPTERSGGSRAVAVRGGRQWPSACASHPAPRHGSRSAGIDALWAWGVTLDHCGRSLGLEV